MFFVKLLDLLFFLIMYFEIVFFNLLLDKLVKLLFVKYFNFILFGVFFSFFV